MQENIFKFILSSRYQTSGSEDPAVLVVHMTPDSVLNTDEYKTWMERFEFSHSEKPDSIKNPANLNIHLRRWEFSFVFPQVSIHNRTPDPQRTRQHGPQRQKPQDSGSAEHDSPRDLPTTPVLQLKGIQTNYIQASLQFVRWNWTHYNEPESSWGAKFLDLLF